MLLVHLVFTAAASLVFSLDLPCYHLYSTDMTHLHSDGETADVPSGRL